ncbi:hypothetical protein JMUB7517_27900 [Staphylococcus aureus]
MRRSRILEFFNDTATTEIYTKPSSAASDVYKRQCYNGQYKGQRNREVKQIP